MAVPSAVAPLDSWLSWLEQLHPVEIELGLERVGEVARRAGLLDIRMPLITVAGTNGKGSTVAMLAAIYRQAGYRVGDYTSPHIEAFNERIRVGGEPVGEATIVAALAQVEAVRDGGSLTYYEYTTLAAMRIFQEARCEVVVLEVGLGGRLDATNLWSADCAIVTSIALDHQAWLGDDRAAISLEKVAIGRVDRPMIIGDPDPPPAMLEHARQVGMQVLRPVASDFTSVHSTLKGEHQRRNLACVLTAVAEMRPCLPVDESAIATSLREVEVRGRMEVRRWQGRQVVLDVAHNPAAALALASMLATDHAGRTIDVIFASLADKDVGGIVRALAPCIRHWHCMQLDVPRALPVATLTEIVRVTRGVAFAHADAASAWRAVAGDASADLILVTGSFHTVGAVSGSWSTDAE